MQIQLSVPSEPVSK